MPAPLPTATPLRTASLLRGLLPLLLAGCGGKVCWFGCGDDTPDAEVVPVDEGCPSDGTVATWDNFAEGYIRTYCTPCHSSGLVEEERYGAPVGVDFDTYDSVVAQAALIKSWATGPTPLMPPVGGPSDHDRELLREWIDCGMPGGVTGGSGACSGEPRHVEGPVVVASEADVADFCAAYNGVAGDLQVLGAVDLELDCVCEITGDLEIGGEARSVRLSQLRTVDGAVAVREASSLTGVELPKLDLVGGDLEVVGNPALATFGVPTLDEVGGSLVVEGNGALAVLWASQLDRTGGDWRVVDNVGLVQVSTDHLLEIGGSFVLEGNPDLELMSGQAYAVEAVGGDILIRHNPVLEYPELAFQELLSVGGDVEFVDNDAFTRVDAFEKLPSIPGHLWIRDNELVAVVNGFDHLEEVGGSVDVSGNSSLMAIDNAFRILTRVGLDGDPALGEHQLRIQDNPMIASLGDLLDVNEVGGLVLSGSGSLLTTVKGFHLLTSVDDAIEVYGNAALFELDAFGALKHVGGELVVRDNPVLYDFSGLYTIGTLPGSLRIERNPTLGLLELGGDGALNSLPLVGIGGDLVLVDNDGLKALPKLATLKTVGGDLVLADHAALSDLTALYGLTTVGGGVVITDNAVLPTASAEALRDAIDTIGGAVTIDGNAP